jgi:hypothetical protein
MSLIAPIKQDAPLLFNWDNNISWTYGNNMTDSIKEKVKSAGGSVDGELRVSLEWYNFDDLDIHVIDPAGYELYFSSHNKSTPNGNGKLDVDANGGTSTTRSPVENIIYKDSNKLNNGVFKVIVNQFRKVENTDIGCEIEVECRDQLYNFVLDKAIVGKTHVANIHYTKEDGITRVEDFTSSLNSSGKMPKSNEVWGIKTNQFHKVNMILNSPNFWNTKIGNEHIFLIIDKAINDTNPRGIFNEYLRSDLHEYRKVFEMIGNKLKVESSDNQLSGLGFSVTQRNDLIVRINSVRVIKVKF